VGAVLLSRTHRVLSVGYNGLPAGIPGCASAGNCPRGQLSTAECARDSDYFNCAATHAERNAIEHADPHQLAGATIYVTRKPCPACTTLIKSAGIRRVVVRGKEIRKCSPLVGRWRSMLNRVASFLA
jgi:dCMP deaminase